MSSRFQGLTHSLEIARLVRTDPETCSPLSLPSPAVLLGQDVTRCLREWPSALQPTQPAFSSSLIGAGCDLMSQRVTQCLAAHTACPQRQSHRGRMHVTEWLASSLLTKVQTNNPWSQIRHNLAKYIVFIYFCYKSAVKSKLFNTDSCQNILITSATQWLVWVWR